MTLVVQVFALWRSREITLSTSEFELDQLGSLLQFISEWRRFDEDCEVRIRLTHPPTP